MHEDSIESYFNLNNYGYFSFRRPLAKSDQNRENLAESKKDQTFSHPLQIDPWRWSILIYPTWTYLSFFNFLTELKYIIANSMASKWIILPLVIIPIARKKSSEAHKVDPKLEPKFYNDDICFVDFHLKYVLRHSRYFM